MNLIHLTSAELTEKLKTARGAKRRAIIGQLQHRYNQTVPLRVENVLAKIYYNIPRYDFALHHGESGFRKSEPSLRAVGSDEPEAAVSTSP